MRAHGEKYPIPYLYPLLAVPYPLSLSGPGLRYPYCSRTLAPSPSPRTSTYAHTWRANHSP